MKALLAFVFLLVGASLYAQSTKEIISKGIKSQSIYETDYSEGLNDRLIVKQEFYNEKGQLIELKEYNSKGEPKLWEKYTYTINGELETELYLDKEGDVEKKIINVYNNGLRVEKQYYDAKNRLVKKKEYVYEYKK